MYEARIGSLCSGYGGLDLAVMSVLGGSVAWHAEVDPDASRVLEHHWPGVPNLGDLRAVDWSAVEPVDVLAAGFPCQPVSQAGLRAGTNDDRWLFDDIAEAIGRMDPRPELLMFENVRGLLVANNGDAMARVVHGLAALGYVGSWRVVRASDAEAPHQRERVFIVARLATNADGELHSRRDRTGAVVRPAGPDEGEAPRNGERQRTSARLGRAPAADTARRGAPNESCGDQRLPLGAVAGAGGGDRPGPPTSRTEELERGAGIVDWGQYGAAVARWERILGRPAPRPTVLGPGGAERLNPQLPEWMLGLPDGWVTDVPGLSRNAQNRILGNGVCPQQGALALRLLLPLHQAA